MKHSPEHSHEPVLPEGAEIERLTEVVDELSDHVKKLEREGSEADISSETVERVQTVMSRIKNLLKVSVVGLLVYGGIKEVHSYSNSRYEITTEAGADGKIEYQHEDAETTRILKFLTGAAELAPEDKVHFYRELLRNETQNREMMKKLFTLSAQDGNSNTQHESITFTLEEQIALEKSLPMDEAALRQILYDYYAEDDLLYYGEIQADIEERVNKAFTDAVEATVEYDPVLERVIWNMQIKVGAPRIRWSAPEDNDFSKLAGHIAGAGRSVYSPSDNTIYITPGTTGADLLAENAHAQQFNEQPVESRVRAIVDGVEILIRSVKENQSLYEAQFQQYESQGSIEHEAHEVIEKQLSEDASTEYDRIKNEQ